MMETGTSAERIRDYLSDESRIITADPETVSAVHFPENEADIINILKSASQRKIKI